MNKINQVIAQAFLGAALLAQTCFHTTSLAQEGKVNRLAVVSAKMAGNFFSMEKI